MVRARGGRLRASGDRNRIARRPLARDKPDLIVGISISAQRQRSTESISSGVSSYHTVYVVQSSRKVEPSVNPGKT